MELMTAKKIAEHLFVSRETINYWHKIGRLTRHQPNPASRRYFYSLPEAIAASKTDMFSGKAPNLITREEATYLLRVSQSAISRYCKVGYLTKHYVVGNNYSYMLDREEVLDVPRKIELAELQRFAAQRGKILLRGQAGRFIPKDKEGSIEGVSS
jgi:predicted site-specific integrase-resolvase